MRNNPFSLQNARGIRQVQVTDITDPSTELNAISGGVESKFVLCYEVAAGTNSYTLYAWDSADSGSENVPYKVDGSSGMWVAIAGKYVSADSSISDKFVMQEISAPAGDPDANSGWLYLKDDGGSSKVYFESDDGTVYDLTATGSESAANYRDYNENDTPGTPAANVHRQGIDSNGIPYTVDENGVRNNLLTFLDNYIPGGLKTDGTDDLVNIADNANLDVDTGDFSLEFAFIPDDVSGTEYICNKEDSGVGYGLYKVDDDLYIRMDDGTTDVSAIIGTAIFEAGKLYIGAVSFDRSGNAVAVVNKKQVGTVDISMASLTLDNAGAFRIASTTAGGSYSAGVQKLFRVWNRALTVAEMIEHQTPGYRLPYADIGASQTDILSGWDFTSGWVAVTNCTIDDADSFTTTNNAGVYRNNILIPGHRYRLVVAGSTSASDIDFLSSYGVPSASNSIINGFGSTEFIALTDTLYIRNVGAGTTDITTFELTSIGCVLELLPENMGRLGAIETMNGSHGSASGGLISLSAEQRPLIYRDVKLSIANTATTLTNIVPPGYMIESIRAKASASVTAVKIGTSSGGQEVVASSTAGTTPTILTLAATAHDGYSESASDTLYAEHATAGETLDLIFTFRRAG